VSTPNQTIRSFLASNGVAGPQKLKVAAALAESMIHELKAALDEWEAAAEVLRALNRENIAAMN
jgi:hypothetical protein